MLTIGRIPRVAAAFAALVANVALAGGLASLAHHYDTQLAQDAAFAVFAATQTAAAQCRPARAGPG